MAVAASAGGAGVCIAQPADGLEYENPRSKTKDGEPKMSRRSEESVLSWRNLCASKAMGGDACDLLGALVQLPLAITAIYTSGGRSIHALCEINARSKGHWDGIVRQIRARDARRGRESDGGAADPAPWLLAR